MARAAKIDVPVELDVAEEPPLVVRRYSNALEAAAHFPPCDGIDFAGLRAILNSCDLRFVGTKGDKKLLLLARRVDRSLLGRRTALVEFIVGDYSLLPGVQAEFKKILETYRLGAEISGRLTPPDDVLVSVGWKSVEVGGQKLFYLEPAHA